MKLTTPLLWLFTLSALTIGYAEARMPRSQILLADLNTPDALQVHIVSDNTSYNNQPYLTDNGVYFTHEVVNGQQSQTDIAFYDFISKQVKLITNTPQSEYSPTLMPQGKSLSAIVVEADAKQKLWQYPLESKSDPTRIFDWIEPVGYHAWGSKNDLLMFILGEPHTLQYTSVAAAKGEIVATDVGRTLIYNPKAAQFLFSHVKNEHHYLARFSVHDKHVEDIFRLPSSVQDFILKDGKTIAYAVGNRVYTRALDSRAGVSQWLDLSLYCNTSISRMSYKHNKLAFVCGVSE